MRLIRSVFIALALSVSILGAVAVADQPPVTGQETVYVTKSGNKYHTAICGSIPAISRQNATQLLRLVEYISRHGGPLEHAERVVRDAASLGV